MDVIVASVPEMNAAVLAEVERLSRAAAANGGSAKALKPDAAALSLFPALIHLLGSAAVRPRVCDATFPRGRRAVPRRRRGRAAPGLGGIPRRNARASRDAVAVRAGAVGDAGRGRRTSPPRARAYVGPGGRIRGRSILGAQVDVRHVASAAVGPDAGRGGFRRGRRRGGGGDGDARATRGAVARAASSDVSPLLADEDPIPLYALKLLGGALEADRDMCAEVVNLGLAPKFFEFLSLEHTNNNVHNVRLCLVLASSRAVPMSALCEYGAGRKVAAVLEYAHENAVEPFLEPALGISRAVLARAAEARGRDAGRGGDALAVALDAVVPLAALAPVLIECAAAGEAEVTGCAAPQLAAESLRLTVELLPEEAAAATLDFPARPFAPPSRRWAPSPPSRETNAGSRTSAWYPAWVGREERRSRWADRGWTGPRARRPPGEGSRRRRERRSRRWRRRRGRRG